MIPKLLCAGVICAMIHGYNNQIVLKSQRVAFPITQELLLADECYAINEIGEIKVVLAELNEFSKELTDLELSKNPDAYLERVQELRALILERVRLAKKLLKEDWTNGKWVVETNWKITSEGLIKAKSELADIFIKMEEFELTGLELGGIERSDLYPLIEIQTPEAKNEMEITLIREASTLELCQMNSSLMVKGKLKFNFDGKDFTSKVQLAMKPGAIRSAKKPLEPVGTQYYDKDEIRCRILNDCTSPLSDWLKKKPKHPFPKIPVTPIDPINPYEDYL